MSKSKLRHTVRATVAGILFGLLAVAGVVATPPAPAVAADLSQFQPGNIISDAVFFNKDAMSEAQIQAFLNSKVAACSSGYKCLKDHSQATTTRAADAMCNGYAGAGSESAARIIYKVAQSCGMNPQVILVMLQKEQGLVLDSSPSSWAWTASMGYACPDTAACDTRYYGFFNQVYMGVWQLKRYGNPPGTSEYFTWFPVGKAAPIRFSPNAACGSANVTVQNKATAALYYYTPYQPNGAALAAGYGASSDPCSAYGNRNFYNYFNDWFGSSTGPVNPFGNVEVVSGDIGKIRVAGWAIDPNTASPIDVHVYVDGVGKAVTANVPRTDVGAAYPGSGANHGFDVSIPASGGTHSVCVYGMNNGPGANVLFGCWDTTTPGGSPIGKLDPLTADASGIKVSGWMIDPDVVDPISVHVYVDGVGTSILAKDERSNIDPSLKAYGTKHGFSLVAPASEGSHTVCVYGINTGTGANLLLSCSAVTVPSASSGITEKGRVPVGALESVTADASGISVSGWALDPDTASSIQVHLYVDEVGKAVVADKDRSDLPSQYAAYGKKHGFQEKLSASAGVRNVCAYGINTQAGGNVSLGCKSVTVPSASSGITEKGRVPVGALESVTADASGISVSGWALDPDTASPIQVHVYVGAAGTAVLSDRSRADVAAAHPGYGDKHGYAASLTAAAGPVSVCVYAINTGPGGNFLLGCKTVTVPAAPAPGADQGRTPIGNLEGVVPTATGFLVSGWALDPDVTAPIQVHIYVGAVGTAFRADSARSDVGALYPSHGQNHGFSVAVNAPAGTSSVCAYGINNGAGGPTLLGCKTVSR